METHDLQYPVNDLYFSVQGEGAQTGVPMAVLRLHGCDVGCPWCDTKETWQMDPASEVSTISAATAEPRLWCQRRAWEVAEHVLNAMMDIDLHVEWVLITGGEPALYTLAPLVAALQLDGFKVAIETSGTGYGALNSGADWLTVSPKLGMPGGKAVLPELVGAADEVKHVVGKYSDIENLLALIETCKAAGVWRDNLVCLQPLSCNERATELCVEQCLRTGWRLSIQTHKFAGLK